MFCSKCGTQYQEGSAFCSACGNPLTPPQAAPNPQPVEQSPQISSQQPVQQPIPQPAPQQTMYTQPPMQQTPVYNPSASQQPAYARQPAPQPVARPVYNAPTNTTYAETAPKPAGSFFDRLRQDKLKMGLFFGSIGFVVLMIIGMIIVGSTSLIGTWVDTSGNFYVFNSDGTVYMCTAYGRERADWEKDGEVLYLDDESFIVERKGNYLYISDDDEDENPSALLYRTSMRTDYSSWRELNKTTSLKEINKLKEKYEQWRDQWREETGRVSYAYAY